MSNNHKKANLKASIADIVGPLLKRLELAKKSVSPNSETVAIIDKIRREVVQRKDSFNVIQNRDRELTGYFGKIERKIVSWIDDNDEVTEVNESNVRIELTDILNKLSQIPCEKASYLPQKPQKAQVAKASNRSDEENELSLDLKDLEDLDVQSSLCLYSLSIFPERTKLKRRFVIYWWIGLGLLPGNSWEKAEHHGDNIFADLINKGFLKSVHIRKHNKVINLCTINLTIYKWFFSTKERADFISPFFGDWFNTKVLLNLEVGNQPLYLNSDDISKKPNLQVAQLGNWRYTETKVHNKVQETGSKKPTPNDHIEVDKIDFLKKLGGDVTYLSLRGISGIEEVPVSIGKLENLMILDLKACHNLDKLPQKRRSTLWKLPQQMWFKKLIGWKLPQENWFKKLTVLDISECYLLDYMPRWICQLSNLEVLKGFVVGRLGHKNRPCRLDDLSKLNKLRKLTIRIAKGNSVTEDFSGLKNLQTLLVLTIIWGDNKYNSAIPAIYFPVKLEKLDIRCYPADEALDLLKPAELINLKRLYIRGGNLTKIPCNGKWKVEILRLRFLKMLVPTDWNVLKRSFQNLRYVEYVGCPTPNNFPNGGSIWSKEEVKDTPKYETKKQKPKVVEKEVIEEVMEADNDVEESTVDDESAESQSQVAAIEEAKEQIEEVKPTWEDDNWDTKIWNDDSKEEDDVEAWSNLF